MRPAPLKASRGPTLFPPCAAITMRRRMVCGMVSVMGTRGPVLPLGEGELDPTYVVHGQGGRVNMDGTHPKEGPTRKWLGGVAQSSGFALGP